MRAAVDCAVNIILARSRPTQDENDVRRVRPAAGSDGGGGIVDDDDVHAARQEFG